MQEEVWEEIPNYEGIYEVSNYGRIKSLPRSWKSGNNAITTIKERILKISIDLRGYCVVSLYKNGIKKTHKVHQLVAICFLNHTPDGHTFVVDHIDNNSLNNYVDNLQITTTRINSTKDRIRKEKLPANVYRNHSRFMVKFIINGEAKYFGNYILVSQAEKKANEIRIKYNLI